MTSATMPDYYTLLQYKIREAENEPAKLRELVYEAARLALKRHVNVHYPAVSLQDGKRLITDLEAAIERLETDAGGAVTRPPAPLAADKAESFFVPPGQVKPAFQEFDFRTAFEGGSDNRPADRKAGETPSGPPQRASDPVAPPGQDGSQDSSQDKGQDKGQYKTATVPTQPADDQLAFTISRDNDTRPDRAPRPNNRFATGRTDSRPGIAASRRGTFDRAARNRRAEHQGSVPNPTGDQVGPRDWLDDVPEGGPPTRELVLVPDPGVQTNRGATYLVRPDGSLPQSDAYFRDPPAPKLRGRTALIAIGIVSQVAIVVLAGAAFYVAMWGRSPFSPARQDIADVTTQRPAKVPPLVLPVARPDPAGEAPDATTPATAAAPVAAPAEPVAATPAFPRPNAYGVYAVSDNRLIELEQVPTAPVDPRTRSTLQIVKPSRTVIDDPKLTFVAFRRDLISSAPDKVPVRIAARIAKQMTFDGNGKAATAPPPTDTWLIREQGYDLRVSPVRDTPEMVVLRPESEDFSFPPGRYVLMLGAQSYDFVIAGPVTETAQCVEGVATARGPAFYECRTP
jgi:hypothetical protein